MKRVIFTSLYQVWFKRDFTTTTQQFKTNHQNAWLFPTVHSLLETIQQEWVAFCRAHQRQNLMASNFYLLSEPESIYRLPWEYYCIWPAHSESFNHSCNMWEFSSHIWIHDHVSLHALFSIISAVAQSFVTSELCGKYSYILSRA